MRLHEIMDQMHPHNCGPMNQKLVLFSLGVTVRYGGQAKQTYMLPEILIRTQIPREGV